MIKLLLAVSFLFLIGCECNDKQDERYNFEDYTCTHEQQVRVTTQGQFCFDHSPHSRFYCGQKAIKENCTFNGTAPSSTSLPFSE